MPAAGFAYERFGIGIFLWVLMVTNGLRLLIACWLPRMPAEDAHSAASDNSGTLYAPAILFTILGAALINASHAMLNTFAVLDWTAQGISESAASLAISFGVLVEIAIMWWFGSLTRHVSARMCLMLAACAGVVRWLVLATQPSLVVIFLAQALHGITFGVMFLASAIFISRRVAARAAARGQSLLTIMTTACMASATFVSGRLFDTWGSAIYVLMSLMCVVALLSLMASYRFVVAKVKIDAK